MTGNNNQRLTIWTSLENRFSYKEFRQTCEELSVDPMSVLEFAQKAGIAQCAITAYPDLAVPDAYLQFINDNRVELPPITQPATVVAPNQTEMATVSRCGSCGGGKVR